MSWLSSALSWWQWALLLSVPPAIVLLYFLKLKRQPLEVPSTFLWHRTIEDLHVNSIWQRLRQNLLLFLQLLLLALAILACLRPSWRGTKLTDDRFIFLIDNSASMSATDVAPSRLEEAKKQVSLLIDEMKSGDVAMIIAFSDRAQTIQPFTDNRRLLQRRLEIIKPSHRTSDLEQAFRFAAGLANPGRSAFQNSPEDGVDVAAAEALPATMFIFSDGRVRSQPQFSMGNLKPVYIPIGSAAARNLSITAFQSGQNPEKPEKMQAFASFENFTDEDTAVQVNLYLDGNLIDAARVDVPHEGTGGAEFTLNEVASGVLKLEIEDADDLTLDNLAYAVLNVPRRAKVLFVSPGNEFMELALGTEETQKVAEVSFAEPGIVADKAFQKAAATGAYDLVIFDQCAPQTAQQMPLANTLFIGRVPPVEGWGAGEVRNIPQIIDVDRVHPLMQFVEMGNVEIVECTPLQVPKGGTVLIDSDLGTLLAVAPREGFEDAVLGFEILGDGEFNTLWPRRPSFPLFIQNVLVYLGGVQSQRGAASIQPGQLMQIRGDAPTDQLQITAPDGKTTSVSRSGQNAFVFGDTDEIGIYEVREGKQNKVSQRFAANLFDGIESNIRPLPEIRTEYEEIKGQVAVERTRREAWKALLLVALVVLIVEWYVYNRRVYL